MSLGRGGCLQVLGIVVFAVFVGGFLASTWLQHQVAEPSAGSAPADSAAAPAIDRSRVRVDVRNGSGLEGAAGRMTEHLRRQGFDVVDFGNADRFDHPRTYVVDRGGGTLAAREVAAALQGVAIETAPDSSPYLDVTVIVGEDLDRVLTRRPVPEARGWRGWLDRLRRR